VRILPKRFAVVTRPLLMAGCMIDPVKVYDRLGSGSGPKAVPGVAFADLKPWVCVPREDGCQSCTNGSALTQTVYLQSKAVGVQPTQKVTVCADGGARVKP
jgi:hypothetical protein